MLLHPRSWTYLSHCFQRWVFLQFHKPSPAGTSLSPFSAACPTPRFHSWCCLPSGAGYRQPSLLGSRSGLLREVSTDGGFFYSGNHIDLLFYMVSWWNILITSSHITQNLPRENGFKILNFPLGVWVVHQLLQLSYVLLVAPDPHLRRGARKTSPSSFLCLSLDSVYPQSDLHLDCYC